MEARVTLRPGAKGTKALTACAVLDVPPRVPRSTMCGDAAAKSYANACISASPEIDEDPTTTVPLTA